jgi:hypothetical protein
VEDEIHAYGILWETPKVRPPPLKDLVKWEDNTETYLKVRQQDGVDWIYLDQDKGISRGVVNKGLHKIRGIS